MAGSQLKRLKASLRERGITGPQQSKKQRRKAAHEGQLQNVRRLQRGAVLESIHEQFNPFDLKHAKGPKFEVTSDRPAKGDAARGIKGRPGLARAAGEERRRQTLLVDMQRRNKVGGILDRRFGEDDPTMSVEDKMMERFALEKQRNHKRSNTFDLEVEEPYEDMLTHGGESLAFEKDEVVDDFHEDDLEGDNSSDLSEREGQRRKRVFAKIDAEAEADGEQHPERKKTRKEVMEEVVAKSKLHKFERQAAKEDDDETRTKLDQELPELRSLMSSRVKDASRRNGEEELQIADAAIQGKKVLEANYDLQVRLLAQARRAQPAERIKSAEEKAEITSKKLQELESKRQRRMEGEEGSDTDQSEPEESCRNQSLSLEESQFPEGDSDSFGLGSGVKTHAAATPNNGFDDEDDFLIEEDLIASGSELESLDSEDETKSDTKKNDDLGGVMSDEDDEFVREHLGGDTKELHLFEALSGAPADGSSGNVRLPSNFSCPQSREDLTALMYSCGSINMPKVVQRVRAAYHPKLHADNREKLAVFAVALLDFVAHPWDEGQSPSFDVLEHLIRHVHSLAKMFPMEISKRFRHYIETMSLLRPTALQPSDLILLTAVGAIFPTSDHFHQIVTPAMLALGRYLGQVIPTSLADFAVGTFLATLSLQYQKVSKRYVPELINFCLNAVCAMSPLAACQGAGNFPQHEPPFACRIEKGHDCQPRKLKMSDCVEKGLPQNEATTLKIAIFGSIMEILDAAADLWGEKIAFLETFAQVKEVLRHAHSELNRSHLPSRICDRAEKLETKLERMLRIAQMSRRTLELHHHRPLAIKTHVPKFEDAFDPDKHYDPDRERAELAKLKAEHKKERKGALRELRKDANFMARENLRIKKVKDEAYEKKYKRLIAEIQSEEGREANSYERERQARKRTRNG